ncbi:hypothetical protein ACJ7V3_17760 [Halomonas elongata]|uniref:hypothetical protein n=1 Tax=Halomonas elongata TaxID=2746 RepID=UPI0038D36BA8
MQQVLPYPFMLLHRCFLYDRTGSYLSSDKGLPPPLLQKRCSFNKGIGIVDQHRHTLSFMARPMLLTTILYRNLITYFLTILLLVMAMATLNSLKVRHYHFPRLARIIPSRYVTIIISHRSLIAE